MPNLYFDFISGTPKKEKLSLRMRQEIETSLPDNVRDI